MKLAICGLWHVHANDYYNVAKSFPDTVEVVGVYEPDAEWRRAFCERTGLREFATLDEMIASGVDAASVCVSTDTHADVMVRLAEAGIDIFTEKVMALTSADCDRIADAVERNGVRFVISLPHKYMGPQRTAKRILDSGELGKVNYFRYRNAHSGSTNNWLPEHFYSREQCGGGAMIDLGAHGMYLTDWYLGMPAGARSVFTRASTNADAVKKNSDEVEDNAVTVMYYDDGCIAINETGFVSNGYPILLEIGGERGRVYVSEGKVYKCVAPTYEYVEVEQEPSLPLPIAQFCTGEILEGCGIKEAKNLTRLMEMAYENA